MRKPQLLEAAIWYADHGVPVLPLHFPVPIKVSDYVCSCSRVKCESPAKHPYARLAPRGLSNATTDVRLIRSWWKAEPRLNIGLLTGVRFDALDLDGPAGMDAYREMIGELGGELAALAVVRTGRLDGGRQYYLSPPLGRNFAGGRGGIPAGMDGRGVGGYVVAVPSRHISGRYYAWERPWGAAGGEILWERAHAWLTARAEAAAGASAPADAFAPPAPLYTPAAGNGSGSGSGYGAAALGAECAKVAATGEGGRNDQLNISAAKIGSLAAGGQLDRAGAEAELLRAALAAGLGEGEALRTIASGFRAGERQPRRPLPRAAPATPVLGGAPSVPTARAREDIEEDWEEPETGGAAPPEFPPHVLGERLGAACTRLVDDMQTMPDLVGVLTLATAAATVQGRGQVHIWRGWYEPMNLYACAVAGVGETKSPALAAIARGLRTMEAERQGVSRPRIADAEQERRIQEGILRNAETAAMRAGSNEDRLLAREEARLQRTRLEAIDTPVLPRLLAGDMTAEALTKLLAEQGGVLACLSAEGGLIDTLAGGRYSGGVPNLDAILQAHDGREPILVDRKGGEPVRVDSPCLTLGLAVQPRVLERAGENRDAVGRGLLARFLYAVPQRRLGTRDMRFRDFERSEDREY